MCLKPVTSEPFTFRCWTKTPWKAGSIALIFIPAFNWLICPCTSKDALQIFSTVEHFYSTYKSEKMTIAECLKNEPSLGALFQVHGLLRWLRRKTTMSYWEYLCLCEPSMGNLKFMQTAVVLFCLHCTWHVKRQEFFSGVNNFSPVGSSLFSSIFNIKCLIF